jgi:hypothetical protein
MQTQIKQIVGILEADATLQTLLGGTVDDKKIYPAIADQFESFPCITYQVVGSSFRTVPLTAQDITLQFSIYADDNSEPKQKVEDIFTRLNALLNYYKDITKPIVYIRNSLAIDQNETDRRLFVKIVRYQIWALNP